MTTEKTVRELAVETPQATQVFEKFGIDYCCGGGRTLSAACAEKGVLVEEVQKAISNGVAAEVERQSAQDWTQRELSLLVDHITATHHVYLRQATVRIHQY
jgi:regulator of cell morphogenesis and NO signaling